MRFLPSCALRGVLRKRDQRGHTARVSRAGRDEAPSRLPGRAGLSLLLALTMTALAACSADPPRGTIIGILTLERPVRGHMIYSYPSQRRIELVRQNKVVTTVSADSDGDFRARPRPGRYTLRGITPTSKPCASRAARVVVRAGRASHVDLLRRTRRGFPS